ncbi:MAG: class I SAM-dependent methyltransferase [Pseudomonadota bacterium]
MNADAASGVADIGSDQADLDPSTDRYARRFEGPAGEWLLSRQTKALRRLIAPWPQATVLDVGGGHGQVATPLLEDGHKVRVLASSEVALGQVRAMSSVSLSTEVGPLTALAYSDQSFDVVASFRILAHIGDWRVLLREMARVARHAVIVDFPIPGGANALEPLLFGLKQRVEGDTRRFQTITRKEVRASLSEAGLAEFNAIGQFVLPMVLHRKLGRPRLSGTLERGLRTTGLARVIGTPVVLCARRTSSK